ncbi:MAG: tetratricopeptide repeat protein [Treponema sp.]|jgi:tetratricopeptide (TPR) repeat protein|nr:tetratricopeptide repeat protein [Treponema sp.]
MIFMKVPFPIIAVFILLGFQLAAQTTGGTVDQFQGASALQNYRIGRDMEAGNRMAEAETYYNEAVRICQSEVSRNTATSETYAVITWALRRQNKYADVIIWGEWGLSIYPDEFRIVETMGEAYFYLGDYNRSLAFMQRYTNAAPQGERASVGYFFIGEIYRLTGRYRHADIAYTTAVRLEPGSALWWYRLATVRNSAGDREPAIEAYQQALRLNPNYREAREGLALIQAQ